MSRASSIDEDDSSDIVKVSPPTSSSPSILDLEYDEKQSQREFTPTPSIKSVSLKSVSSAPTYSRSISSSSANESISVADKSIRSASDRGSGAGMDSGTGTETETSKEDTEVKKESTSVPSDEQVVKDVHGVMEDTVKRVRERSEKLQRAARPYADKTRSFAEQRPILFTFLAIWVAFSAIPLMVFIGFVVAATVFIGSTAVLVLFATLVGTVLIATGCLVGTILFGATLLLPVLFLTTLFAVGALTTLVSLFLLHRLYLHISAAISSPSNETHKADYESVSTGLKSWAQETLERVESAAPIVRKQADKWRSRNKTGGNPLETIDEKGALKHRDDYNSVDSTGLESTDLKAYLKQAYVTGRPAEARPTKVYDWHNKEK